MLCWHFIKEDKNDFIDCSGEFVFIIQSGLTQIDKEKDCKSHKVSEMRSHKFDLIISGFTHLSDSGCKKFEIIINIDGL